jgi:uncharacterized protein
MVQAAYGTILYFTDTAVIDQWKLAAPPYADRFAQWADHSSGILQGYVWTALTVEGMGANLQVRAFATPPLSMHRN